jgi:hypothetical protein
VDQDRVTVVLQDRSLVLPTERDRGQQSLDLSIRPVEPVEHVVAVVVATVGGVAAATGHHRYRRGSASVIAIWIAAAGALRAVTRLVVDGHLRQRWSAAFP